MGMSPKRSDLSFERAGWDAKIRHWPYKARLHFWERYNFCRRGQERERMFEKIRDEVNRGTYE